MTIRINDLQALIAVALTDDIGSSTNIIMNGKTRCMITSSSLHRTSLTTPHLNLSDLVLIVDNVFQDPHAVRKFALSQDEFRITKLWIPDSIIMTSNLYGTSAYGASFRPVSISLSKAKKNKGLNADIGARLTYAYINDTNKNLSTHFFRLGLDGRAELRVPMGRKNSLGIGWTSQIYMPQGFLDSASNEGSGDIMPEHVGQISVKYYYRFPYKYKL